MDYATTLLQSSGTINANAYAQKILQLETRIAKTYWDRVAKRDTQKTYNRSNIDGINKHTPLFYFAAWLKALGVRRIDAVVIKQPSFFESIGSILNDTAIDTLREYLRLRLIDAYAPYLNAQLVLTHFNFHSKALLGVAENKPRWKEG